ncbi:LPS assembly protein LptD [Neiella marina]|uniref:LPS-assembly protein LptD n=1 Tax=Neiella holothuriorum TaxID=2870530 RepID=A0ABS7EKA6_9GAMM|nr:LPS assembly protein LptD [Neiella holothuriorum]MBW8192308.1 LPS assembly protein LptD [Neiella holothuriorum]
MSTRRNTDVFVILSLLFSAPTWANSTTDEEPVAEDVTGQCLSSAVQVDAGINFAPVDENLPLTISADNVSGDHQNKLAFTGQVKVTRGQHSLTAEQATMDRQTQQLEATGNVHYQAPNIVVDSSNLSANGASSVITMSESSYQMVNNPTHGSAEHIEIRQNDKKFVLIDGSFTTCPKGDESWVMNADEIQLDGQSEWGEARNSVIRVGNVPVLWLPYMTFPLSDKRKSGLLFPTISNSSRNGLDLRQPYYWNIAPNVDATLTPRYIGNSGTQLGTEIRYLREKQYNQFNLEYLSSDDAIASDDERYLYRWLHQGRFTDNIRSFVEYTAVSDDNYFNDLGSDVASETDNRLERIGQVSFLSEQFDSNITVTDFDIFGDTPDVYRQLPRVDFTYRLPYLNEWFNAEIYGEYNRFDHTDNDTVTADRFHVEPTITYNWHSPAAEFEAEAKIYQTYYDQDTVDDEYSSSVNRTLPSLRLYGQLNFEREISWFGNDYTQRLEPQVQYLLIGHQQQDEIGLYDTVALREDVHGLYRDRRFSGLDRIADTNQITLGATTRLFNSDNKETLRFSFGQIFYFDESKIIEELSGRKVEDTSAFATALDTYFGDYSIHAEYRYNFERSDTDASSILVNYSPGERKLIQLGYRYSPEPLNFTNESDDPLDSREINQLGSVVSWPLSDRYQLVASHYRDTDLKRSVETLAGIQYQSCCWAVRLVYQRNLNTNFPDENESLSDRDAYDSGIALQFELKGLGGNRDSSGHSTMIDQSLFGYRKNYYLNN